jgi:hypothetical protein
MNSRASLTPPEIPGASFDPDLLYQFKVDNNGDHIEDKVLQVTFQQHRHLSENGAAGPGRATGRRRDDERGGRCDTCSARRRRHRADAPRGHAWGLAGAPIASLLLRERFEDQENIVRARYGGRTTTLTLHFTRGEAATPLS